MPARRICRLSPASHASHLIQPRLRLHPKAMGLGLAAGLVGELVLSGHLFLSGGVLVVVDPTSPADVLAHSTLD
jgi:hypothetical protein